MPTLPQLVPDAEVLLAFAPEELGKFVLEAAVSSAQNQLFSLMGISAHPVLYGNGIPGPPVYPEARRFAINRAVGEAWQWLEVNLLIMPAEGQNGHNGYRVLTRRGEAALADGQAYDAFVAASAFPKALLHPAIAENAWLDLARGEYDVAVFRAFRAVEEEVRDAGGYAATDIGVDLMRRAFNPDNGPLSKMEDPAAERQALQALFAGAIGSYKNPHSHRTVEIAEPLEAQEMVMIASHLLRIVDSRR